MGRKSVKANKNIYQITREALGLSREKASEILAGLTNNKIEKIENERETPRPEEILIMSKGYKTPHLCNYYCSHDCPIGKEYVPEIKTKDLSQIILEVLAYLNAMDEQKERLIEITHDGKIDNCEIDDFIYIQQELEKLSVAVETLQLWSEKMLAEGKIDRDEYEKRNKKA